MSKLNLSRQIRTNIETYSATRIQAIFRGHFTRMNAQEINHYAVVHKQIRSNIRSYLANKYSLNITMSKYKKGLSNARNKSAVTIQCAYFRYLSRKCLRRRRYELWLQRRRKAAIRIQAMIRGASSRARVKLLVERLRIVLFMRAATTIQAATRRHLARRKVHRRRFKLYCIASHMIQNWYRARYTRKMSAHIKSMLQFRRCSNGAKAMQCLVRKFLARRRVDRIRLRRLHKLIFRYVTVINCLIRKFLSRRAVQRKRVQVREAKEAAEARLAQQLAEEAARKEAEETRLLLESVDLFLQAQRGNTAGVEDIFTGLASTEEHDTSEVQPAGPGSAGDNLLTIACATGNLDLVRKCLLWGFDINFRNELGFSAFMIAAKHNHLTIMLYLLAPPAASSADSSSSRGGDGGAASIAPLDPISEEDAGFLLVTAAANAVLEDDLSMLVKVLALPGVDVNAKNAATGMTAVHAACEVGHVEAFKLLVKHKADLEVEDDLAQTPLHKACCNSFKITELILGLDPSFSTYMSDAMRVASIMKVDSDGKDCILHAALNGQTDTLDLLSGLIKNNMNKGKSQKFAGADLAASEEIGWSPNDITKALKLVETGNLICLKKIADIGFDVTWVEEESGRTLAIAACQSGDIDMIDLVLSFGTDFSAADIHGRTPVHYAALCRTTALLPHLLTHPSAAKCNISEASLLKVDGSGDNVFHIAAKHGVELNIDLLAQRVLGEALETKNNEGMTPIIVAATLYNLDLIKSYMKLGASAHSADAQGHDCLWHLLHLHSSSASSGGNGVEDRRPLCSEYILHPSAGLAASGVPPLSRKDKDEEIQRVASEMSVCAALIRAGCSLYPAAEPAWTPEIMREELAFKWNEMPTSVTQRGFQPGDVLVQEMSLTLLKSIISEGLVRRYDAWRLCKLHCYLYLLFFSFLN